MALRKYALNTLPAAVAFVALALAAQTSTGLAHAQTQAGTVIVVGPGAARAAARHGRVVARLTLVGGVSATVRAGELGALAREPGVSRVSTSSRMIRTGDSGSTLSTLYPLIDNADKAWKSGVDGRGVGIAIIDSGVSPQADFGNRLVQVRLPDQPGSLDDAEGHGTLVAGVAGGSSPDGRFIGIAPGANIYAINVSRGDAVYSSDVVTALNWVFENAHARNIRVVNLSVSETQPSSYKENILNLAVERLWASGVLVVAAAGNGGAAPRSVDFAPANDPLVLSVGATDDKRTKTRDDDTLATFSARGTTADGFAKPEIVASGRLVASILPAGTRLDSIAPSANRVAPGYAAISGTSFAAPQVAGAAAIAFQLHPDWSPDEVKYTLVERASDDQDGQVGLPILDVGKVLNVKRPKGRANQGVPALVCAPGAACLDGAVASIWSSSSWTSSSWTSSSWTSSSWTSSSWTSSSWTSSSWTSSSWTSSSWTGPVDWSYWSWN